MGFKDLPLDQDWWVYNQVYTPICATKILPANVTLGFLLYLFQSVSLLYSFSVFCMLFFSSSISLSCWMQDGLGDHLCCWLSGSTEYCPIFFSQSLWKFNILMYSKDKIWQYTGYVLVPFILLTTTSGRSEMNETPRTGKITKMENWRLPYSLNIVISLILYQKYVKRNDRPGNNYIISCCSWCWPVMLWRPDIRQHTGATGQGCLCSRYLFQDTDILDWWLF